VLGATGNATTGIQTPSDLGHYARMPRAEEVAAGEFRCYSAEIEIDGVRSVIADVGNGSRRFASRRS